MKIGGKDIADYRVGDWIGLSYAKGEETTMCAMVQEVHSDHLRVNITSWGKVGSLTNGKVEVDAGRLWDCWIVWTGDLDGSVDIFDHNDVMWFMREKQNGL